MYLRCGCELFDCRETSALEIGQPGVRTHDGLQQFLIGFALRIGRQGAGMVRLGLVLLYLDDGGRRANSIVLGSQCNANNSLAEHDSLNQFRYGIARSTSPIQSLSNHLPDPGLRFRGAASGMVL
jgi:hypothetical protein